MKKSKFTTEQIVFALRQAEAGLGVEETCRKLGISQVNSFFRFHWAGVAFESEDR
jgi:putative transposase